MRKTIIAVVGAGLGLAACGTTPTPAVAPAAPVTVTVEPPVDSPVAAAPAAPAPAAPVTTAPAQAPTAAPATATPALVRVPMPDVVGMNLQAAQDLIQEAGVFLSRSEDATGAGRLQINDSNWVVVAQTPAPGELIGEGDAVLSAKKIGE
jgi:hypothetical protein